MVSGERPEESTRTQVEASYRTTQCPVIWTGVGMLDSSRHRGINRGHGKFKDKEGKVEREERYFVANVPWGRLSAEQCLLVVRGHWRIENDCFWSLDMNWKEDSVPGCSKGRATEVMSWLRLMAYNLTQQARSKTLTRRLPSGKRGSPPACKRIFEWIKQAWQLSLEPIPVCG